MRECKARSWGFISTIPCNGSITVGLDFTKGGLTMSLKYGDAVVLVQKRPDGTVHRVNAIVLHSVVQPPNVHRSKALRDHKSPLPEGEYLDLAFPREVVEGQQFKPQSIYSAFSGAVCVPQYKDGATIGWELPDTFEAENAELRAENAELRAANAKLRAELEFRNEASASLQSQVAALKAQPSAADLDAVAEEQKAAEDTSGNK